MTLPQLGPSEHILPSSEFGTTQQLLSEIGRGADPVAVMLTCWELGSAPDKVSSANPGEIVVVQNPGGLVSAQDSEDDGVSLGSVIYGLNQPTVRHLIVCGHTGCKTVGLLLEEDTSEITNPFRTYLKQVHTRLTPTYADRPADEWLGVLVQEVVLQQLANLRSDAYVESRLLRGEVSLHGWIRDDQTSCITSYDPASGQFC
jgi:carbonic anhydrase